MRFLAPRGKRSTVRRKPKEELERNIEHRCDRYAKDRGWTSRKMNGLGFRSWCDRLFVPPRSKKHLRARCVVWVEFKKVGKEPTAAQLEHHEEMRERGQFVHVVDNLDDFKRIIDGYC